MEEGIGILFVGTKDGCCDCFFQLVEPVALRKPVKLLNVLQRLPGRVDALEFVNVLLVLEVDNVKTLDIGRDTVREIVGDVPDAVCGAGCARTRLRGSANVARADCKRVAGKAVRR